MDWTLTDGAVLRDGVLAKGALALADGVVADRAAANAARFDASGLLVLPGLVDIHGDAHERQFQPRPGIGVPAALALRDSAAQLLAAGITTAFLGVTLSWEPGLRGIEAWRRTLAAVDVLDGVADGESVLVGPAPAPGQRVRPVAAEAAPSTAARSGSRSSATT